MIDQVKKLVISELQTELQDSRYKKVKSPNWIEEQNSLYEEYNYDCKKFLSRTQHVRDQKFNWFQKTISRRKEYKVFKKDLSSRKTALQISIEHCENANSLSEMGLDFKSAYELLKSKKIPVVLAEEDKKIFIRSSIPMNGLEGLVLVHKTQYPPSNNRIRTVKEARS